MKWEEVIVPVIAMVNFGSHRPVITRRREKVAVTASSQGEQSGKAQEICSVCAFT